MKIKMLSKLLLIITVFNLSIAVSNGEENGSISKILIIGNSITFHGPASKLGWSGNWGMAASAKDSDYIHLLMKAIRTKVPDAHDTIVNAGPFEKQFWNFDTTQYIKARSFNPDLLILRLGENVPSDALNEYSFSKGLKALVDFISNGHKNMKVCITTRFWPNKELDDQIRQTASENNWILVDLSDLNSDPLNKATGKFSNPGVAMHPSDRGMRMIFEKILEKINPLFTATNSSSSTYSLSNSLQKQNNSIMVGAYYFGGWTSLTNNHLTKSLRDTFTNREPVWGWVTTKQDVVTKEIDAAADAGLSFFSFCWYYKPNINVDSLNRALYYYHNAPNHNRLKYCLMVANHQGYEIGPANFSLQAKEWLKQFKDSSYVTVDGKPLLIFYTVGTLVDRFGSTDKVKTAFDSLRNAARQAGLRGISIAVCIAPGKQVTLAQQCGFDILTAYNYHTAGFTSKNTQQQSIDSLMIYERKIWNYIARTSSLPYIPVATLNWDPRPWANASNSYKTAPYFVGYSSSSVYNSVKSAITWINNNPGETTKEKIALLYAWNEYGEGAWLTPSKNEKENLLDGVKNALK